MACVFTREFILEQIESLKTQLAQNTSAMEDARKAQSYSFDSGQTRTSVTRMHLAQLRREREQILTELQAWETQLCGGVTHVRPVW